MTKKSQLKLILVYLTLFLLLIPYACKKADVSREDVGIEERFFQISNSTRPELINVINDIKVQNSKYNFVKSFASKNGMPNWDNVVSNYTNGVLGSKRNNTQTSTAATNNTNTSREIFFIPLVKPNGSINAYIVCVKNLDYYNYKVYKRDIMTQLQPSNDTIKVARQAAISMFGLFERLINNKDTINVGGYYPEVFFNVEFTTGLNTTGSSNRNVISELNTTSTTGFITQVCTKFKKPCPGVQQESNKDHIKNEDLSVVPSQNCYDEVCFQQADMGWTSGGGTGGTGGSGGGSDGTTTIVPGYNCPPNIWWCESGDYRIVRGQLFTPDNYPYKNEGWPWLWWERSFTPAEQQILNQLNQENAQVDANALLDCKGSNRTGNIKFQGTIEHWLTMIDYVAMNPIGGQIEYGIPGTSGYGTGNRGYADIVNTQTGHVFEIKPLSQLSNGITEVNTYVTGANLHCRSSLTGPVSTFTAGISYTPRIFINPARPNEVFEVTLNAAGVLIYTYKPRATNPVPTPIPASVADKLKKLIDKLKDAYANADLVIMEFLQNPNNSELLIYLKGAAVTAAVAIVVGTILEDIATAGAGIADDWASFTLAYKVVRVAWAL